MNEWKNWNVVAYGCVVRGDEDTSEDELCTAPTPETAKEIADRWNDFNNDSLRP